jgi:hypothetical protein
MVVVVVGRWISRLHRPAYLTETDPIPGVSPAVLAECFESRSDGLKLATWRGQVAEVLRSARTMRDLRNRRGRQMILGRFRIAARFGWILVVVTLAGCATAWQDGARFHRIVPTPLVVESVPTAGRVFLNDRYVGDTPLSATVDCEEEVRNRTRKVSYWVSQPGLSLLLSITSLGLYIPFSVIPVDPETSQEPTGVFRDSALTLRVEADGHSPWSSNVVCSGQGRVAIHAVLEKP